MDYEKGTVLKLKNITFKETDKIDFRLGGHPVILPVKIGHNEDIYFFTSSSQVRHYSLEEKRYFLTGDLPECGLPDKSIIDLKHAYKWEHKNYTPKDPIPESHLHEMLEKINAYEDKNLDSDYIEFLSLI